MSECEHCVATTFKMTEQGTATNLLTFSVKLEHSSMETIKIIEKDAAMGIWRLAVSSRQCTHSCITKSSAKKHKITQVTQPLYSPDLAPCDFWLFPKLNSPLKGKRFPTIDEIQENTTGQLMATGRPV